MLNIVVIASRFGALQSEWNNVEERPPQNSSAHPKFCNKMAKIWTKHKMFHQHSYPHTYIKVRYGMDKAG